MKVLNKEDGAALGSSDPRERINAVWTGRGYLGHVDGHEAIQHVTFHLADSIPKETLIRLKREVESLTDEIKNQELRKKLEDWSDSGHGSCVLKEPKIGKMVQDSLLYFHGERYQLFAWTIMPNHVHVLFEAINTWTMPKIVASWKKHTARHITAFRKSPPGHANLPIGRFKESGSHHPTLQNPSNPVWQREYWDRYIRNENHFLQAVEYIRMNPVKAGLVKRPEEWPWSSFCQSGDWRARGGVSACHSIGDTETRLAISKKERHEA